jgi:excisionase family DNA binding protein
MTESNFGGLKNYPDVMDIDQVSRFLGVSTKTGYAMLRNGKIAYLKVGRSYRIPKSSLKRYLKSAKIH